MNYLRIMFSAATLLAPVQTLSGRRISCGNGFCSLEGEQQCTSQARIRCSTWQASEKRCFVKKEKAFFQILELLVECEKWKSQRRMRRRRGWHESSEASRQLQEPFLGQQPFESRRLDLQHTILLKIRFRQVSIIAERVFSTRLISSRLLIVSSEPLSIKRIIFSLEKIEGPLPILW